MVQASCFENKFVLSNQTAGKLFQSLVENLSRGGAVHDLTYAAHHMDGCAGVGNVESLDVHHHGRGQSARRRCSKPPARICYSHAKGAISYCHRHAKVISQALSEAKLDPLQVERLPPSKMAGESHPELSLSRRGFCAKAWLPSR